MKTFTIISLFCVLLCVLNGGTYASASDTVERESLKFNDAVTKLEITRDKTIASYRYKSIVTLTTLAKNRARAKDETGCAAAWRAVLKLDKENVEARAYYTTAGTLEKTLAELEAESKPVDLLGLGADK